MIVGVNCENCKWGFDFGFWEASLIKVYLRLALKMKKGKEENFTFVFISIYCVKKVGYGVGPLQSVVLMSIFCVAICIIKFLSKFHLVDVVDFVFIVFFIFVNDRYCVCWTEQSVTITHVITFWVLMQLQVL